MEQTELEISTVVDLINNIDEIGDYSIFKIHDEDVYIFKHMNNLLLIDSTGIRMLDIKIYIEIKDKNIDTINLVGV